MVEQQGHIRLGQTETLSSKPRARDAADTHAAQKKSGTNHWVYVGHTCDDDEASPHSETAPQPHGRSDA